jgi:hypothetical protein
MLSLSLLIIILYFDHNIIIVYRVKAIILYRQTIRDNKVRTILFSEEFGKITTWEKSSYWSDVGSIVEVIIDRKNGQNLIIRLTPISFFNTDNSSYEELIEYLNLLNILYETLPEWSENRKLYEDICFYAEKMNTWVWKVCLSIIMQARILKIWWYLNSQIFERNSVLRYFYDTLDTISMKSMLWEIPKITSEIGFIRDGILEARHTYSYRT